MHVAGQQAQSNEPAQVDPVVNADASASANDTNQLKAQLAELQEQIRLQDELKKKANDDAAKQRIKARQEAEAKGEHQRALELRTQELEEKQKRLAELEVLEPDAKKWREHLANEAKRIDAEKATLAPHWQQAIDAAPTVEAKRAILNAISNEQPASRPKPGVPANPAAPSNVVDLKSMTPKQFEEQLRSDPKGLLGQIGARKGVRQ